MAKNETDVFELFTRELTAATALRTMFVLGGENSRRILPECHETQQPHRPTRELFRKLSGIFRIQTRRSRV